jgi:hypothetical protein
MKSITYILVSILIVLVLVSIYLQIRNNPTISYIILKNDFVLENGSILKKGTILRYNQGFSEGFVRFSMYVNIEGEDIITNTENTTSKVEIPYWAEPTDLKSN